MNFNTQEVCWVEYAIPIMLGIIFNTQEVRWAVYVEDSSSFNAGYEF